MVDSLSRRALLLSGAACAASSGAVAARPKSGDRAVDALVAEVARAPRPPRAGGAPFAGSASGLPDLSFAGSADAAARAEGWFRRAAQIGARDLSLDARETLDVLLWDLRQTVRWHRWYWLDFPLAPYTSNLAIIQARLSDCDVQQAAGRERYLRTLEAAPRFVDQIRLKLLGQVERGIAVHSGEIETVLTALDAQVARGAAAYAVSGGTGAFSRGIEQASARFVSALTELAQTLRQNYLPRATSEIGLWRLPDGDAFYRDRIAFHLSKECDPAEVHAMALEAIAAADAELARLRRDMGVSASAAEFHDELLNGARWRANSADEVAAKFNAAIARMEPQLARYFRRGPVRPFGVAALPAAAAASFVNGYYQRATPAAQRGTYMFNASDLENTSWFWAAPLIYHELVPGHHLQVDAIFESMTLSPYHKSIVIAGPVEGWAEYARGLALEMGLYDGDAMNLYAHKLMDRRFAMTTAVDTGIHHKQWTLEEAIDFISGDAITRPPQRRRLMLAFAIDFPGYALSYHVGGQEFARLRQMVSAARGDAFDVRAFHDVILSGGILPFPVLETRLRARLGMRRP